VENEVVEVEVHQLEGEGRVELEIILMLAVQ
jgi:hypothetical protein